MNDSTMIEIPKSKHERLLVSSWERRGDYYVSIGVQRLDSDGHFRFMKTMTVKPASARQLADALVEMANSVENMSISQARHSGEGGQVR